MVSQEGGSTDMGVGPDVESGTVSVKESRWGIDLDRRTGNSTLDEGTTVYDDWPL